MRVYERNGKKYLSVTSIIDLMYGFDKEGFRAWALKNKLDPEWVTRHSAELGERYHAYFENKFYGISEWADIIEDDIDSKYRCAADDFYEQGWEILDSEQEVYCDKYGYAGRFDAIIKNDKLGIKKAIGDIKTWGAWNRKLYKPDSKKLKKLANQLTMYNYALPEKLPMFLIVPQINGRCIVESIDYNFEWKDWINNNTDRIKKLLQA